MEGEPKGYQRFLACIHETPDLWKSIDARIIALKIGENWHNLGTYISLDPKHPEEVRKLSSLLELPYLSCRQEVLPISELDQLLTDLIATERIVSDQKIHYKGAINSDLFPHPYSDLSDWSVSPSRERNGPFKEFWNGHILFSNGERIDTLFERALIPLRRLHNDLLTSEFHIEGLNELGLTILGKGDLLDLTRDAFFQIYAPYQVWINEEKTYFELDTCYCNLYAGSDAVTRQTKLCLSSKKRAIHRQHDNTTINTIVPKEKEWIFGNNELQWSGNISFPETEELSIVLQVGKYPVQKVELEKIIGNPRERAYQVFDPEMKIQIELINNRLGNNAIGFERAVARLFTFLGFETDILSGSPGIKSATPDILAYAISEKLILVIECTSDSIDAGGKLGKLLSRSKAVAKTVPEYKTLSILATSMENGSLSQAEREKAQADRIIILAQEDLRELIKFSCEREAKTKALQYFESQNIPANFQKQEIFIRR